MIRPVRNVACAALLVLLGCAGPEPTKPTGAAPSPPPPPRQTPPPSVDYDRPIEAIALRVDIGRRLGLARYTLAAKDVDSGLTLDVGNLAIESVSDDVGVLKWSQRGTRLDVGVPKGGQAVSIRYRYGIEIQFNGALPSGSTFIWPSNCGNLFPCRAAPRHGSTYSMELTGIEKGKTAVYPKELSVPVPAYIVGWSIGEHTFHSLGKTNAGTEVGYYTGSLGRRELDWGTAHLLKSVDWIESTIGPYSFGKRLGPVSVEWTAGGFSSMENHPFWHMDKSAGQTPIENIHQAAHGWFGNAVRIKCWEDFVLSEGTASYLAARALESAAGVEIANATWLDYESRLDQGIAWPKGCGKFDVLKSAFVTTAPYNKGALFFRALERKIGRDKLDPALASFYSAKKGTATTFSALLTHIETETDYDPLPCAEEWLREPHAPAEKTCP